MESAEGTVTITEEKLREWEYYSKIDDYFRYFVLSDIRVMLGEIRRLKGALDATRK